MTAAFGRARGVTVSDAGAGATEAMAVSENCAGLRENFGRETDTVCSGDGGAAGALVLRRAAGGGGIVAKTHQSERVRIANSQYLM